MKTKSYITECLMKRITYYILLIVLPGLPAGGQDLVTDRPDFTESALVVPARTLQFESGVELNNAASLNELDFPKLLTRIGLGRDLELRLGIPNWKRFSDGDVAETYFTDLLVELNMNLPALQPKHHWHYCWYPLSLPAVKKQVPMAANSAQSWLAASP